jgi:hypothetical protein
VLGHEFVVGYVYHVWAGENTVTRYYSQLLAGRQ